ncbi:hypothetical protein ANRL2_03484 [Anaerolineae bacterium]|nr:hypothetical protein ANRL2_03484 [Anaerolineae bacterium]
MEKIEGKVKRVWNKPQIADKLGHVVLQCPQCSTLNSIQRENCRRCSSSLKSAPKIRNPYL